MWRSQSERIARKFVSSHTSSRLRRRRFIQEIANEQIGPLSKEYLQEEKLLALLNDRISHQSKLSMRLALYSTILIALLCASILGVRFELSLLGLTLSDLQRVKEFIVAGTVGIYFFAGHVLGQIEYLAFTRDAVLRKLYGDEKIELMKAVYQADTELVDMTGTRSARYTPTYQNLGVEFVQVVYAALQIFPAIIAFFCMWTIVLFDVWIKSNLPHPIGRWFVILIVSSFVLEIFYSLVVSIRGLNYFDREKQKSFEELQQDESKYREAVQSFIKRIY